MKAETTLGVHWPLWAVLLLLGFWIPVSQTGAEAQNVCPYSQGYNAVWGTCIQTLGIVGTPAFLDASAWCDSGLGGSCLSDDFCAVVKAAINDLPNTTGGVVDARGVVRSDGSAIPCASNPFPSSSKPTTVLLPSTTIVIEAPWILPGNTRISGQGRNTILEASNGNPFPNFVGDSTFSMIEMGTSPGSSAVVVEQLRLVGNGVKVQGSVGVGGIYNGWAKDGSYVDHVDLFDIGAVSGQSASTLTTGLLIDSGAVGSGPYSNINFPAADAKNCTMGSVNVTCVPTACVQIRAATRGLHGLTCTAAAASRATTPAAAIYLDASNNTIEDAHFEGYYDSIVVGDNFDKSNATVSGNTIWNISGDDGGNNSGPTTNAIHICNPQQSAGSPSACAPCGQGFTCPISDLSIFQAQSGSNVVTIQDDLTNTTVNSSSPLSYTGIYLLGGQLASAQYSRFTTGLGNTNGTSQVVPTWSAGSTDLSGGVACTTFGALYSNTGGGANPNNANTLFLCSPNTGKWAAIK
jgi:hypothetical protein